MTEETIAVPLHAETRRGTLTRSSITIPSSKQSSGNLRRNSTGRPNPPNPEEKTIPNHLRASTGSCHDFCKYGHKRASEMEEKKHIPKRIPTTNKQHNAAITISVPAKLKVSSDSKTHSPNSPEIIKREIKVLTSSKQNPTNIKKIKDKNEMNMISSTKQSVVKPPALLTEKTKSSSLVKVLAGSSGSRKSDVIQLGKMMSSTDAKKVKAPTISLSPKSSVNLNLRKPRSVKVGPPLNSQNLIPKNDHEQKGSSLNAQNLILKTDREQTGPPLNAQNPILETDHKQTGPPLNAQNPILETDCEQTGSPLNAQNPILETDRKQTGPPLNAQNTIQKTDHEQTGPSLNAQNTIQETDNEQTGPSLNAQIPILETDREQTGPSLNAQNPILETNREQTSTDSILEKTLHVDAENKNEENFDSEFTDTEAEDDFESEDQIINIDCDQGKVKFRRGHVVDLECENNSLRKLRFRQGRILGDNEVGKGDVRRRKFKNGGTDKDVNSSSSSSSNDKSGKVVLRHQDCKEKKHALGLFNNVIEETANKLVEIRKSKVKALVGAFETVISLQETNKSSTSIGFRPIET